MLYLVKEIDMKILVDSSSYKIDLNDVDVLYVDSSKLRVLSMIADENSTYVRVEWLYAYVVDHEIDIVFVHDDMIALGLKDLDITAVRIV